MRYANASELLSALEADGVPIQAPIDVDEIASWLDLDVSYDRRLDEDGTTGRISLNADGSVEILINPIDNSYEPRRRFTLAHEIGHFCLHINEQRREFVDSRKTMSRSASYWDTYETQANTFAAQLLMPKNLIIQVGSEVVNEHAKETGSKGMDVRSFIQNMAYRFNVSIPAMEYRLQAIGLFKKNK